MLILKQLSVMAVVMAISSAVIANTASTDLINTKAVDKDHLWVVSPGTRLVAGSKKQNEFFILGAKANVDARLKVAAGRGLSHKVGK